MNDNQDDNDSQPSWLERLGHALLREPQDRLGHLHPERKFIQILALLVHRSSSSRLRPSIVSNSIYSNSLPESPYAGRTLNSNLTVYWSTRQLDRGVAEKNYRKAIEIAHTSGPAFSADTPSMISNPVRTGADSLISKVATWFPGILG